jgi:4-hydroxy-tetrahydrodipicolinate synthase
VVSSPPTFFRHREDEVVAHYEALGGCGLPVVAYNTPRSTPLTRSTVDALAGIVAGVKDSSGDLELLTHMVSRLPVSQGDERQLADALRVGARGITPGIANLAPQLALDLFADRGDADQLQSACAELMAIHQVRPGVPT